MEWRRQVIAVGRRWDRRWRRWRGWPDLHVARAAECHETRRYVPVRPGPRPLHGESGGREEFSVREQRPHGQVITPLSLAIGGIGQRTAFTRRDNQVLSRSRQYADDVRRETSSAGNYISDANFVVRVG